MRVQAQCVWDVARNAEWPRKAVTVVAAGYPLLWVSCCLKKTISLYAVFLSTFPRVGTMMRILQQLWCSHGQQSSAEWLDLFTSMCNRQGGQWFLNVHKQHRHSCEVTVIQTHPVRQSRVPFKGCSLLYVSPLVWTSPILFPLMQRVWKRKLYLSAVSC